MLIHFDTLAVWWMVDGGNVRCAMCEWRLWDVDTAVIRWFPTPVVRCPSPPIPPTENLYTLNSVATRSEKKEWQFKCDWHRDCWVGVFRRNRMIEWYLPSTSVHLSTAWAVSRWFGGSIFFSPRTVDTDWRYAVWGRGDSYYRWRLRAWNINQRLASLLAMKWSVRGNRWVRRREMETILPPSSDVKSALIALPPTHPEHSNRMATDENLFHSSSNAEQKSQFSPSSHAHPTTTHIRSSIVVVVHPI